MYRESTTRFVGLLFLMIFLCSLNICSEVLDGIRLYFDYTVNDLLLYKSEQGQIETKQAVCTSVHLDKEESRLVFVVCKFDLFF